MDETTNRSEINAQRSDISSNLTKIPTSESFHLRIFLLQQGGSASLVPSFLCNGSTAKRLTSLLFFYGFIRRANHHLKRPTLRLLVRLLACLHHLGTPMVLVRCSSDDWLAEWIDSVVYFDVVRLLP